MNYLSAHGGDVFVEGDPRFEGCESRRLAAGIEHWLGKVGPGAHIQLKTIPLGGAIGAGFSFDRDGAVETPRYRATNVGFGLSHILSVLVALFGPRGSLCLVENPEAHLHPSGQTKPAELAARAALAGAQVIAETHSDHFMDGVRIAVRDGPIRPGDAAFHYFERKDGAAVATSPTIDRDGRLSEWPAGFFDQHEKNLARLLAPSHASAASRNRTGHGVRRARKRRRSPAGYSDKASRCISTAVASDSPASRGESPSTAMSRSTQIACQRPSLGHT